MIKCKYKDCKYLTIINSYVGIGLPVCNKPIVTINIKGKCEDYEKK